VKSVRAAELLRSLAREALRVIFIDEGESNVPWEVGERFDDIFDSLVGVGGSAHAEDFVLVPFGTGSGSKEICVDSVGHHPDPLDRDAKVSADLASAHG
jgi:hypothetical protein